MESQPTINVGAQLVDKPDANSAARLWFLRCARPRLFRPFGTKSKGSLNAMEFIPAGEVIGEAHQVRSVRLAQSTQLPDGEYTFIDMYCSDPSCDCRKTMVQVRHEGRLVAIINYGWEPAVFYEKWMGSIAEDDPFPAMHGASIDITSPNLVSGEGILGLFNALLDDVWIGKFKRHYKEVKSAMANKS